MLIPKILLVVVALIGLSAQMSYGASIWVDTGSPNSITAADGTPYSADTYSSNAGFYDYGQFANFCSSGNGTATIAGTRNPRVYQTVGIGPTFNYSIPVTNGCYDVYLHFAECGYGQPGHRRMNVTLNGARLLDGLDIFAEAGAATMLSKFFPRQNISVGLANLAFSSTVPGENAVISAIDLVESSGCTQEAPPPITHIFVVVLENANAADALAQPFMGSLAARGAYLDNYHGIAHPSQPNYIAMVAGSTFGVVNDNSITLNASHLGDLLEAKGKTWKIYAEEYPLGCFASDQSGNYARRHNPFISFANIQNDAARCIAHLTNSSALGTDITNHQLPTFSLYVPGLQNDGHDTGVAFADQWLSETFGPRLADPDFMNGTLFIVTFDENESSNDVGNNLIYTLLYGVNAKAGFSSEQHYNHYSLLQLIESTFGLGSLSRNDSTAQPINDALR